MNGEEQPNGTEKENTGILLYKFSLHMFAQTFSNIVIAFNLVSL